MAQRMGSVAHTCISVPESWAPRNTTPYSLYSTEDSGLSSLGFMLCKNGWAHQWEAGGSCKTSCHTAIIDLPCHTTGEILVTLLLPREKWEPNWPHPSVLQSDRGARNSLQGHSCPGHLLSLIVRVCNTGTLPEDILDLKVLMGSFNWMKPGWPSTARMCGIKSLISSSYRHYPGLCFQTSL